MTPDSSKCDNTACVPTATYFLHSAKKLATDTIMMTIQLHKNDDKTIRNIHELTESLTC